ncbi:MAG: TetR family transcriptional regulator, partial [Pikeienuella sp.]
ATPKSDDKAETMKRRLCAAVVACIDKHGYADTSINAVQVHAGVSRGALTHHFPTKQALMAETALRLLANASTMTDRAEPTTDLLMQSWTHIANTSAGRAFVEILIACRTDKQLHGALASDLAAWDESRARAAIKYYRGSGADPDDAALLWSICRAFIRGMIAHERFISDPAYLERMMRRFAEIMSAHLTPKETP